MCVLNSWRPRYSLLKLIRRSFREPGTLQLVVEHLALQLGLSLGCVGLPLEKARLQRSPLQRILRGPDDRGSDRGKRPGRSILGVSVCSNRIRFRFNSEPLNAVQMRLRERFLICLLAYLSNLHIERGRLSGNLRRQHALETVRYLVSPWPIHIPRHEIRGHGRGLGYSLDELQHRVCRLGTAGGIGWADLHAHIVGALI